MWLWAQKQRARPAFWRLENRLSSWISGLKKGTKSAGLGAKSRNQFGWFCRQVRGRGRVRGHWGLWGKAGGGQGAWTLPSGGGVVASDRKVSEAGMHQAELNV